MFEHTTVKLLVQIIFEVNKIHTISVKALCTDILLTLLNYVNYKFFLLAILVY